MQAEDHNDLLQSIELSAGLPIQRILSPFVRFAKLEAAGGLVLGVATVAALVWANSPWASGYDHFWHRDLSIGLGRAMVHETLLHFINDGLMALFFFFVGLEIKHELLAGELSTLKRAIFPMAAAVGGVIFPALLFIAVAHGTPAASSWGIPIATDIAFVLGAMALLGNRVPLTLKVFVTALAIVDDILAVTVIAIFYTSDFSLRSLVGGLAGIGVSYLANRLGVRAWPVYAVIGIFVWVAMLQSGVHATVAGILLALTIPAKTLVPSGEFLKQSRAGLERLLAAAKSEVALTENEANNLIYSIERRCVLVQSPLSRIAHALQPWVTFFIMPVFALANAGVHLPGEGGGKLWQPIAVGVFLGLFVGKPIGVFLFAWLSVKLKMAVAPEGVSWRKIFGASWLCGIGFTMSLFIATLSVGEGELLEIAKIATLLASVAAGVAGSVVLAGKGREQGTGIRD
ncbi:MAG TPA: Na+/H+ antiporter NhaA [Silvibacterium sp.]|nr:Na+/H+ antiporter NhaA [Silvibacterium sp.]